MIDVFFIILILLIAWISGYATCSSIEEIKCFDNSIESTISLLQNAGFVAQEDRFKPDSILGGISISESDHIRIFHDSFTITPYKKGYLASVTGPGNLSRDWVFSSRREAAKRVIEELRARTNL